jgi:hypothetical protein
VACSFACFDAEGTMSKKRFVVWVPADCTYLYEVEAGSAEEALDRVERGEAGEYELHTDGYAQPARSGRGKR